MATASFTKLKKGKAKSRPRPAILRPAARPCGVLPSQWGTLIPCSPFPPIMKIVCPVCFFGHFSLHDASGLLWGPKRGHSFCRIPRCRRMLGTRVCVHTTSLTSSQSSCPSGSSSHFLLFLLNDLPFTNTSVVTAGGEPGWSWTAARRPHRDHTPGGTLRGRPPQRLARALPCPGPHAPNLRRATERCGWVGKQPAGGDRRLMRN